MPRWLRIALTGWTFFVFFAGSPLIGLFVLPVIRLFSKDREDHRRRCTLLIGKCFAILGAWVHYARLVDAPTKPVLPGVTPGQPYVMVTNHPSLIDIFFLLGMFEGLTCVAKGSWYSSFALRVLLRQTAYLPGPTAESVGEGAGSGGLLDGMVEHLEKGYPLLVFPEGTRSALDHMHRFRRGAVEAAVRAKVPLVALFVSIDRPFLMKGVPFWKVPSDTARYSIEVLDVIDTRTIDVADARQLNAELQGRFHARFARMLAERAESPSLPSGEDRESTPQLAG